MKPRLWPGLTAAAAALLAVLPACDRPTPVAPEGSMLTISATPTRIEIDGTSMITVIARRADGTPVNEGTVINLSSTLGNIPANANTDDAGVARANLVGDGQRVGTATVTASSGASGEVSVDVQVGSVAGQIDLEANPNQISRDAQVTEVSLLAVVQDTFGTLLPNVGVTFSTEAGSLASGGAALFTDVNGQVVETLTVRRADIADNTEGFFTVTARATGEGGTPIEGTVEIDITGGPASIFFQATPTSVSQQTGGTVQLLVGVRDASGEALPGANANFLSELGSLASGGAVVQTGPDGTARDTLTVTAADLAGFPSSAFTVRAQVAGFGGIVLEETQSIRIQTGFPVASFTFTVNGSNVTFMNTSTGQQPLSCSWNFGQGANPGTSSQCPGQTVTYTTPGNKTVTLNVSNSLGSDQATASFTIQ